MHGVMHEVLHYLDLAKTHEVLHVLDLLKTPGICAAVILVWATGVRLFWRRRKSVRMP